jgi:hypothetical protein
MRSVFSVVFLVVLGCGSSSSSSSSPCAGVESSSCTSGFACASSKACVPPDNATSQLQSTQNQIAEHGGTSCNPVTFQNGLPPAVQNQITQACAQYESDLSTVCPANMCP